MTAEILKKYIWNETEYCNILYGDATCITLRGEIGQYTDEQWILLALELYANLPEEIDPIAEEYHKQGIRSEDQCALRWSANIVAIEMNKGEAT